ncbi:protein-disulfide reductase DsbD domain-containing protein [Tropicibacter oceani]|uniref:Protein-disulfide reductase DsbD family protein n=1 Tax=Tropicibacter oceani TaxID=3058420 RepID=A0ABY8QLK7_9RHOB|nr:protein-disulfide reductase DsbD domain-containing protein [Tropicibacter oceani]WGW04818.1 protein-disulfide reductase DsbD family protein [Tropicibacter oceani]
MMKISHALFPLLCLPALAGAGGYDNVVQAQLRPGWRLPNGDHMAALHLTLAPGWKTYWRAPGDAGIPPLFDWRGNQTSKVEVSWPAPHVFHQSGMRSVGYKGEVVLPLRVSLRHTGKDSRLRGIIDIGICKDVCLPHRVRVEAILPATGGTPDPLIAAAMADVPFSAAEAGVTAVHCKVGLSQAGMTLRTEIAMPRLSGTPDTVIETADPDIWVAEPETRWDGGLLVAETRLTHTTGGAFALDRSGVRITVIAGDMAVDIKGCDR